MKRLAGDYDFIVVGAGNGGMCVLANRLSADPEAAGSASRGRRPRQLDLVPRFPPVIFSPSGIRRSDWMFRTEK